MRLLLQAIQQTGQFEQIAHSKSRSPGRYRHKKVACSQAGPFEWERTQVSTIVIIVYDFPSPVALTGHELKDPSTERVKGVGHLESLYFTSRYMCS